MLGGPIRNTARIQNKEVPTPFDLQAKLRKSELLNDNLKRKVQLSKFQSSDSKPAGPYKNVRSTLSTTRGPSIAAEKKAAKQEAALLEKDEQMSASENKIDELIQINNQLEDNIRAIQHNAKQQVEKLQTSLKRLTRDLGEREAQMDQLQGVLQDAQASTKRGAVANNVQVVRVKRELKDKEMQLTALHAKMDMTTKNTSEYKNRLDEAMTELTAKERDLIEQRSKVQVLTVEMKTTAIAARATDEQAAYIHELQSEVKTLRTTNEKITAVAMSGQREQQHENRVTLFKDKIQNLELRCRAEMQEKSELMKKLGTEQEIRGEILAESRDQQKALLTISAERDKLEQRMNFFTSESAVDIEEMEKALLIVKKRKEHGDDLDFLLPMNERDSIDLRKQLKNTTAAYADTVSELEKCRQLLRIQDDISREYKAQAEDADTKTEEIERSFAAKITEYDIMLENRASRINKLEKQLRDIAYGTNQYPVKPMTLHGVDDARSRTHIAHFNIAPLFQNGAPNIWV